MEKIKFLYREYPILQKLNVKSNGVLQEKLILRKVSSQEYLKTADSPCMGIPFIIKGKVRIFRINDKGEETNLYNIGKGELCHETLSCIIQCIPLNIFAQAVQDSEIFMVPIDMFDKLFLQDIEFLKYLYMSLHNKFKLIVDSKEEIIHESIEERLIRNLKTKNSKIIYSTHEELALEIGTSREVVSRKLKSLEKEGKLKLNRGKIEILI